MNRTALSRAWRPVRAAQILAVLAGVAVAVATLRALGDSRTAAGFEWVNHDVGNILYLGQRMLSGDRLYADLAEANPPAIFFVAEGVAAVARWTHLSPIALFHWVVVLLALFGVVVIQSVYARANRPLELTLSCLAYLLVLTGGGSPADHSLAYSFGQREQLFALAFIPYVLWRLSEQEPTRLLYVLSFLLGYLSSLKPHFAVLFVALELACLRANPKSLPSPGGRSASRSFVAPPRRTSVRLVVSPWIARVSLPGSVQDLGLALSWPSLRRVGPIVVAGASFPYALLLLHSPRSVAALWSETVPLHTHGVYAYFNQPYSTFMRTAQHGWVLGYAAALAYFLWSGARPPARTRRVVVVLPALAYVLVLQQHKFWDYHAVVLIGLLATLAYLVAAGLVARLPADRAVPLLGLLLAAALAQNVLGLNELRATMQEWKRGEGVDARLLKLAPLLAGRHRVLYYSTSISHMRLALLLGQHTIRRWNHELVYPSLVRDPDPERRKRALARYCAEQRQLIAAEKPDAVVFHATLQGLESPRQELFPLLVEQCGVVPPDAYEKRGVPGVSEAVVFLRREPVRRGPPS